MGSRYDLALLATALVQDTFSPGYEIGRACGAWFVCLALLAGTVKCVAISRRPRTSTPCALSLAFLLGGVLVSVSLSNLAESPREERLVTTLAGLLGLTGFILAIVGLSNFNRRERHVQGKAQAITTIVVFGVSLISAVVGGAVMQSIQSPAADREFEEFNFRFRAPSRPWRTAPAEQLNPLAKVAYVKSSPEVYFMVIAERLGVESGITTEEIVAGEVARHEATFSATVSEPREISAGDVMGTYFQSDATVELRRFSYAFWVCCRGGYSYELIAFAEEKNKAAVGPTLVQMLDNFEILDPAKTTQGDLVEMIDSYSSDRFAYSFDPEDQGWYTSGEFDADYTEEDLVLSNSGTHWLSVIPVFLDGHEPSQEAMLEAFLHLKYYDYPEQPVRDRRSFETGESHESRFAFSFALDGTDYENWGRIVVTNGFAYFILGQSDSKSASHEIPRAAIENFTFDTPSAMPRVQDFDDRQKKWHAWFFNELGTHYRSHEAFDQAESYVRKAVSLDPTTAYLRNATQVLIYLDKHREALLLINRYAESIVDDLDLRGDHAWLMSYVGQGREAMREYEALFAAGLRDLDDVRIYLGLLVEHDQAAAALDLLRVYREGGDSTELVVMHANLLVERGATDDAITLLETRPTPRPPEVGFALASLYETRERFSDALEAIDAVLGQGYSSAEGLLSKARFLVALDRREDAKKVLIDGMAKYAGDARFPTELDKIRLLDAA